VPFAANVESGFRERDNPGDWEINVPKLSAGLMMWKRAGGELNVLLVHPGGPFWAKKDLGAWSIPKGELEAGEDALVTAHREFEEELGVAAQGAVTDLGEVKQKGGKTVRCFAIESDLDVSITRSNMFELEWPPRSGKRQSFPEVDRAAWFSLDDARAKINPAQAALIDRLADAVR
jgi:predicted NUDIX family NTP pyrophosphohydrolase